MSQQISNKGAILRLQARCVEGLRKLEVWLQTRYDRIRIVFTFSEVLPTILCDALPDYLRAIESFIYLTRAYTADTIVYSRLTSYASDVKDLEKFGRFLCHKPISLITRRSQVSIDVCLDLMANIFCPHELYTQRLDRLGIDRKVMLIANSAQRAAIANKLNGYQELLECFCLGQFTHGRVFKYGNHIRDRIKRHWDDVRGEFVILRRGVRLSDEGGVIYIDGSRWDALDSEPPVETETNTPSEKRMILRHQLAVSRRLLALTEQSHKFCTGGVRGRELLAKVE